MVLNNTMMNSFFKVNFTKFLIVAIYHYYTRTSEKLHSTIKEVRLICPLNESQYTGKSFMCFYLSYIMSWCVKDFNLAPIIYNI